MTIRELMVAVRDMDLVLPEFQREYVWNREQSKQLMVSLYKGYPTGSLLFWKTADPPEIKNEAVSRERIGTTSVILDGQQRLTTLYLFTQNRIPPYYRERDITEDPRELYFDLESGDFQYYQVRRMENNPIWVPVVKCFGQEPINVFEIAGTKQTKDDQEKYQLAERYNSNLTRLRNVLEKSYPIQTVPPDANIDAAIDVFDRVNSLGTKLSDAELALAHITGKWPHARQAMKDKSEELKSRRFDLDLTFMVRSLTAVVRGRAIFETIHHVQRPELEQGWQRLVKILDYLVNVLPKWAHIDSTADVNTTNVLVPAVVYLARHGGDFSDERSLRQFIRWLYAASSWARYTSQTDQRLDHDVSIVLQNDDPWGELVDAIIDQRGRIRLEPTDLAGRGAQHPFYRMTYVLTKTNGAVDWFNGVPLENPHGSAYGIHSHHIFPQSLLYDEGGLHSDNHLDRKIVNEICNRAFLTGTSNVSLGATKPSEYLPAIEDQYPGALEKQFIPLDRSLWEVSRYRDFLERRRQLIAEAFNQQMDSLLQDVAPAKQRTLVDLLLAGESTTIEFKSTLRWDVRQGQINKGLEKVIAKSIAGLLNTEGGTLVIGVTDEGDVYGIDADIQSLGRRDRDAFEQKLVQVMDSYLGPEFISLTSIRYDQREGKSICIVDVDPSPRPVFLRDRTNREFYMRAGNTTRPLDHESAYQYIGMHWQS